MVLDFYFRLESSLPSLQVMEYTLLNIFSSLSLKFSGSWGKRLLSVWIPSNLSFSPPILEGSKSCSGAQRRIINWIHLYFEMQLFIFFYRKWSGFETFLRFRFVNSIFVYKGSSNTGCLEIFVKSLRNITFGTSFRMKPIFDSIIWQKLFCFILFSNLQFYILS